MLVDSKVLLFSTLLFCLSRQYPLEPKSVNTEDGVSRNKLAVIQVAGRAVL
jgi:hypothetical protein